MEWIYEMEGASEKAGDIRRQTAESMYRSEETA